MKIYVAGHRGMIGSAIELIEIQSGSYLGQDDIARFDDKYERA